MAIKLQQQIMREICAIDTEKDGDYTIITNIPDGRGNFKSFSAHQVSVGAGIRTEKVIKPGNLSVGDQDDFLHIKVNVTEVTTMGKVAHTSKYVETHRIPVHAIVDIMTSTTPVVG